jgi:hypothetical protein
MEFLLFSNQTRLDKTGNNRTETPFQMNVKLVLVYDVTEVKASFQKNAEIM